GDLSHDLREPRRNGSRAVRGVLHEARVHLQPAVHRRDGHLHDHQRQGVRHAAGARPLPGVHEEADRGFHEADGGARRLVRRQQGSGGRDGPHGAGERRLARLRSAGPRLHVRLELSGPGRAHLGSVLDGSRARPGL
ncbi:MAG: Glyoxalase family protein, partial [uncultured Gemmatimonadetes bacterium]